MCIRDSLPPSLSSLPFLPPSPLSGRRAERRRAGSAREEGGGRGRGGESREAAQGAGQRFRRRAPDFAHRLNPPLNFRFCRQFEWRPGRGRAGRGGRFHERFEGASGGLRGGRRFTSN
eukprot:3940095-Rhodomonas_salina.1